jgi:hypothetical protein
MMGVDAISHPALCVAAHRRSQSIASDSKGHITAETRRGRRMQKFVYKGVGLVTIKIKRVSDQQRQEHRSHSEWIRQGLTETLTSPVVKQHWKPPPPSPE